MQLTDDVNVGLFLSHFDEFLRTGDEYAMSKMLIAKISDIRRPERRRPTKGREEGEEIRDDKMILTYVYRNEKKKSEQGRGCGGRKERKSCQMFADSYTPSAPKIFIDSKSM